MLRNIWVLPPGTLALVPAADVPTRCRTGEDASDGYRQALAFHQAAKTEVGDRFTPTVWAAIESRSEHCGRRWVVGCL